MPPTYKNYLKPSNIFRFSFLSYLQSLLSFCSSMYLARTVGQEIYGDYALGLVFFNIVSTLSQFGTEKTLVKDLIQEDEPKSVLKATVFISSIVSILAFTVIYIWLKVNQIEGAAGIVILLFTGSGILLGLNPNAWFDFKGRINFQIILFVLEKLCFLITISLIIFFLETEEIILAAAFSFLFFRILFSLQAWIFVFKNFNGISKKTKYYIQKIFVSNIFIWLAVIGNLIMSQYNQILLSSQVGKERLAIYAVAFQMVMVIRLFQSQLMRLMSPSIATITKVGFLQSKQLKKKIFKFYMVTAASSLLLVVPLFIFAPIIINLTAGKGFSESIPIFRLLLIWILFLGVGMINNQFLIGLNMNKVFFVTTTFFGVASLFLAYSLIPIYQEKGAALSLILAHSMSILIQITAVNIHVNKRLVTAQGI